MQVKTMVLKNHFLSYDLPANSTFFELLFFSCLTGNAMMTAQ
jgi:hypothetical protein